MTGYLVQWHPSAILRILSRIPQHTLNGSGILTGFPSITPFGLTLGPTNPAQINLTQETLGFRRACFLHTLSLLMPTESFLIAPTFLSDTLRSYRMLAYHV